MTTHSFLKVCRRQYEERGRTIKSILVKTLCQCITLNINKDPTSYCFILFLMGHFKPSRAVLELLWNLKLLPVTWSFPQLREACPHQSPCLRVLSTSTSQQAYAVTKEPLMVFRAKSVIRDIMGEQRQEDLIPLLGCCCSLKECLP